MPFGVVLFMGVGLVVFVKLMQVLVMETERFCVPELLFRPSDLPGLEQAGVAEATWQSISALGQVSRIPTTIRTAHVEALVSPFRMLYVYSNIVHLPSLQRLFRQLLRVSSCFLFHNSQLLCSALTT